MIRNCFWIFNIFRRLYKNLNFNKTVNFLNLVQYGKWYQDPSMGFKNQKTFALRLPAFWCNKIFGLCRRGKPAGSVVAFRPYLLSYGARANRKPLLLLRLSGVLLLRLDTRQFCALLFQLPPRNTRLEPLSRLPDSNWIFSFEERKCLPALQKQSKVWCGGHILTATIDWFPTCFRQIYISL